MRNLGLRVLSPFLQAMLVLLAREFRISKVLPPEANQPLSRNAPWRVAVWLLFVRREYSCELRVVRGGS